MNYSRTGIGIYSELEEFNNISEEITSLGYSTSNHAELYAILKACNICLKLKLERFQLTIYSDCLSAINSINNRCRINQNKLQNFNLVITI